MEQDPVSNGNTSAQTCATCGHWRVEAREAARGICHAIGGGTGPGGGPTIRTAGGEPGSGALETPRDFGCLLHQASLDSWPAKPQEQPPEESAAPETAPEKPATIPNGCQIYTDGSASPNPGPGGWAAIAVAYGLEAARRTGAEAATTNNRMELQALIEAFRMLPPNADATILSDSQISVSTVTKWARTWRRNGWRRAAGPISNLDLVKTLVALSDAQPGVRVTWTRGHQGNRWNEAADEAANAARMANA